MSKILILASVIALSLGCNWGSNECSKCSCETGCCDSNQCSVEECSCSCKSE